jgi:hypothetical protein
VDDKTKKQEYPRTAGGGSYLVGKALEGEHLVGVCGQPRALLLGLLHLYLLSWGRLRRERVVVRAVVLVVVVVPPTPAHGRQSTRDNPPASFALHTSATLPHTHTPSHTPSLALTALADSFVRTRCLHIAP